MTSRPVLIVAVVILTVFIAALSIWTLGPNPQPGTPTTPSPTPTKNGTATLGELVLCKDFQKIEGEISCEDALNIAKTKYKGNVQRITEVSNFRIKGKADTEGRDAWWIELKLAQSKKIGQETLDTMAIFLDRKTGEELAARYKNALGKYFE